VLMGAVALVSLSGCAGVSPEVYREQTPTLDIATYFNGPLTAWGYFADRSGEVKRRFTLMVECVSDVLVVAIEAQTLSAENERRQATGLTPYPNWQTYQASLDAQSEVRAKLPEGKRPPLPEEEAFMTESANILLDQIKATSGG